MPCARTLCTTVHHCTVQVVLHDLAQVGPHPRGAHNQNLRKIPLQEQKLGVWIPPYSIIQALCSVGLRLPEYFLICQWNRSELNSQKYIILQTHSPY